MKAYALAGMVVGLCAIGAPAHAFEEMTGELLAEDTCPAYSAFKKKKNPGNAIVEVGQTRL